MWETMKFHHAYIHTKRKNKVQKRGITKPAGRIAANQHENMPIENKKARNADAIHNEMQDRDRPKVPST